MPRSRSPLLGTAVAALVGLLRTAAAPGQIPSATGNLYGTALDEQGKFLSGVAVTLAGLGAARTATTDAKGDFHFLRLSPGTYTLVLERPGFEATPRDAVVEIGKDVVLSIPMAVAGARESVTVTGEESPGADSRKVETGATFDRKDLDTIPTTRDPWSVLRQVPGVLVANMNVNGSQSGAQSSFVGKGTHPDQNTWNLDGVSVTSMVSTGYTPIYFDFDSFQEIGVVTGGSDPSLSTPGVTINLVTRRGTNELRGSARAYYFFPSPAASDLQAPSDGGWDYGVEAGGPLWKDKVWLWAAGSRDSVPGQTFFTPDGEPSRQKTSLHDWNAKANAQLVPGNDLSLFYMYFNKTVDGRNASPNFTQAATWDQTLPTSAYKLEDSHVLSANLFASFYFTYLSDDFTLTPKGGLDAQADLYADSVWHNTYLFYRSRTPQHQAGATMSGFFDTGSLRHELKFGFGYKHARAASQTVWPGGGLIGNEPFGVGYVTRNADYKYEMNYYDTYLADTIEAGSLTLNVGLRYDYQQGKNLPSSVPASPFFPDALPAVSYAGDSRYPITWKTVEPRIGASYALGSDRKTLLRASYARFANQLGPEVYAVNAFPGAAYLYYLWDDANHDHMVQPDELDTSGGPYGWANVNPDDPGSTAPVNQIAHLKPPTTDEFIVGAERQVFSDLSVSLAYTHRRVRNLEFSGLGPLPTIGVTPADYELVGQAVGTATDANGFALSFSEPYYGLTNCPDPCAGSVITNRPDFSESYDGVELQLVKRWSKGWSLRVSAAYNDWRKSVGPGAIVNPNNFEGGSNASGPALEPQGKLDQHGGSFINAKWQFNVSGAYELPLGVLAAANFFGRQGFLLPYNVSARTHDAFGSRPALQIGAVDAYRLPDVFQLDFHLERPFHFGSHVTATPSVDCFNIVDSHTVLQRSVRVGIYDARADPQFTQDSQFNTPVEQLSSRTFRAGVRVSF